METTDTLPSFKLKANSYTLTSLQLLDCDLSHLAKQLAEKVEQAPKFFDNTPIVIDLNIVADKPDYLDLAHVMKTLKSHHMVPIGIRGGRERHHEMAREMGIAILADSRNDTNEKKQSKETTKPKFNRAKIVHHPIRSGQQIYAQGADLIIIGPVSAGAECLADGNIHVYGPLRGRALAGILGDTSAYIFCQKLEAELVSIAGQYRVSEHLKEGVWSVAANVHLKDGHLNIEAL